MTNLFVKFDIVKEPVALTTWPMKLYICWFVFNNNIVAMIIDDIKNESLTPSPPVSRTKRIENVNINTT